MSDFKNKVPQKLAGNPRFLALKILLRVETDQAYSNLLINDVLKKSKLNSLDQRLMTGLVYGTLARKLTLDYYLQPFLVKTKKVEIWVKVLLRMSLFQMLFLEKVPSYALINCAVGIAKALGNKGVAGFVNAVLRNVERSGVRSIAEVTDDLERLALEISMPYELVEFLVKQDGLQSVRELGLSEFEPGRVSGRVDPGKISLAESLAILEKEGIVASPSEISECGIVAKKGNFAKSSLFNEGKITVQDESSQLVAKALTLESHHRVLDACAAPGGKTGHIASFLAKDQGGLVYALDIHPHKVKLIDENMARLKLADVVKTFLLDARHASEKFPEEFFDRILVDAPCSGLGLMRRKPEIKYSKTKADFEKLSRMQLALLQGVVPLLKKKGAIIYSTCTIIEQENRAVVQKFLEKHPNFVKEKVVHPLSVEKSIVDDCLQILPQQYGTDGFFISCLRKFS